jgi:hypothetical protein
MATTIEQLNLWRTSQSEHQRLEFKEAKTQFDSRELFQYCVAIANEGGVDTWSLEWAMNLHGPSWARRHVTIHLAWLRRFFKPSDFALISKF